MEMLTYRGKTWLFKFSEWSRDDLFAKIADEFDEGTYLRRKQRTYEEIMQNYQNKSMLARIEILEDSKSKILR